MSGDEQDAALARVVRELRAAEQQEASYRARANQAAADLKAAASELEHVAKLKDLSRWQGQIDSYPDRDAAQAIFEGLREQAKIAHDRRQTLDSLVPGPKPL